MWEELKQVQALHAGGAATAQELAQGVVQRRQELADVVACMRRSVGSAASRACREPREARGHLVCHEPQLRQRRLPQ